jgi:hypothetical protein
MIKGSATLTISQETMIQAIQEWIDRRTATGMAPTVEKVAAKSGGGYGSAEFDVSLKEPPKAAIELIGVSLPA